MLYYTHKHEQLLMCSKIKKEKVIHHEKNIQIAGSGLCKLCAKMERAIQQVEGVISANVSFMTQKLSIEIADENFDSVWKEVKKKAKKANPDVTILD